MLMTLNRAAMAGVPEESVTAIGALVARPLDERVGDELLQLLAVAVKRRPRRGGSSKTGRASQDVTARRPGGPALTVVEGGLR